MHHFHTREFAAVLSTALLLAACGGGGGGSASTPTGSAASSGASTGAQAVSSGTITAFGSVFVNGHEFSLGGARIVDDDTLASTTDASTLEVGMAVDVKSASTSTASSPAADELHVHPLARGNVDASNLAAGTLTVMGQQVQVTAATIFSDHRSCVAAATSPCAAITGQSGLSATAGSAAGSYVSVDGYLYSSGSAANIVATLVSIGDLPTTTGGALYKAEGVVATVTGSQLTIGALTVDLSAASCFTSASTASTPCASAFSAGQVVSVFSATAPALPAVTFRPTTARSRSTLVVQTTGASVELEGKVSSVTTSPAAFVLSGVAVDASALASGSLPAVNDLVRVVGTVAANGTTVTASSVTVLSTAVTASYGLEGDATGVAAGSAANTFVLSLLGQTVTVDATTWLADRSASGASGSAFNITTFSSYLAASASQHLLVRTAADSAGALRALSVTIAPASTVSGIGGTVDATPAPVNGSGSTPTTFSVHGLPVSAAAAAVLKASGARTAATVAAGDLVTVRGSYAAGLLTVTSPAASGHIVLDAGAPTSRDHDCGF